MTTTVANIRDLDDAWLTDDRYAYVGRAGAGLVGYFGNPFVLTREGDRDRMLVLYRNYFLRKVENDGAFRARVLELADKVLVCFCKPRACHGDVIAEWLDGRTEREDPSVDYAEEDD